MEIKRSELKDHAKDINRILQEVCRASDSGPFVKEIGEVSISVARGSTLVREVTTDFGNIELALRLPVPDADESRYWLSLNEQWQYAGRRDIRFRQCDLRLYYVGEADEAPVQFLRLEWVAPTADRDGGQVYEGGRAGHPHWHIDRAALVGPEEAEVLNAPGSQAAIEEFSGSTAIRRSIYDSSWIQSMHLPAQADWMRKDWNGREIPGPHQCEPENPKALLRWWAGALRYLVTQLPL